LRDESSPGADFFRDAQAMAFAGTPYAHDGVGTRPAFDHLTGTELKLFYRRWYAPNNAVLVVAGDVDPVATLAAIRARFESIPSRPIPPHTAAIVRPLHRAFLRRATALVYPLAVVGYRLPGINSPDFLASYVLQEILDSDRGRLHGLANSGEALDGEWITYPYVPEGQLGFAAAALGPGGDPATMTKRLESILHDYAVQGVPPELFETTKRRLIAAQELGRNSIESLASDWATTIALDGEPSIAREQQLLAGVSLTDVNRAARRYLDPDRAIVGALTPSADASQSAPPAPPQQGPENPLAVQPPVTHLPAWASELVGHVAIDSPAQSPTQTKLPNGITLIVEPETISDSIFVYGRVQTNAALQEPDGKEGVAGILDAIFKYGTQTKDRNAFQRALDDLDSTAAPGATFGLETTSASFIPAVGLLAESELRPRFDAETFDVARRRTLEELRTALNGTHTLAVRRTAQKLLPAGDLALREATPDSVSALTLDDVKGYYASTMRPDLATIVVIGNVSPEAARTAIMRSFGDWHATGPAPSLELPPVPQNGPGEVSVSAPALGQDAVTLEEGLSLTRSAPQYYALQLGNTILGGGHLGPQQSRLFRDLRQNAGLVYSVSTDLSVGRTRSTFEVNFACLPENAPRITTLIDEEIEKMQAQPPEPFELSLVKASLVRETLIDESSLASIGSSLLENASDGSPLDQQRIDAHHFLDTDAGAVRDAFAAYIHPQNFIHVTEGP